MENNQQPLASGQQTDQLNSVSPTAPHSPSKTFIILMVILLTLTVGIGGYILGANQNQVVQYQSPPASPTTQPSRTPDSAANWKTYRNEEFGLEVRYPSVYGGKDNCRPRVVDSGKENAVLFVGPITFRMDNAKGLTLSEYVDLIVQQIEENTQKYSVSKVKSKSNITFSGREAIKLVTQFCGASCSEPQDIYIEKGVNILRINYDDGIINQCSFNSYYLPSEVADQILPTSKFLSPGQTIDTSNWKIYRNTKYGFEIVYPPDWKVEISNNESNIVLANIKVDQKYEDASKKIATEGFAFNNGIYLSINATDQTLEEFIQFLYNNPDSPHGNTIKSLKGVQFPNGMAAVFVESNTSGYGLDSATLLKFKNNVFKFVKYYGGSFGLEKYTDQQFDQILSTFRFD